MTFACFAAAWSATNDKSSNRTAGANSMNSFPTAAGRQVLLAGIFGWFLIRAGPACAQSATDSQTTNEIRILELQGVVEVSPRGATTWVITQTNQLLHP